MTKNEMVQRIYAQYVLSPSLNPGVALEIAVSTTDFFFKNYKPSEGTVSVNVNGERSDVKLADLLLSYRGAKPKKRREVFYITSVFSLEAMLYRSLTDTEVTQITTMLEALRAGKSVRMKK